MTKMFEMLVEFTIRRNKGERCNTAYRKAYWATLNERIKCKPPFVPTEEHNQIMLEVAAEIERRKNEN